MEHLRFLKNLDRLHSELTVQFDKASDPLRIHAVDQAVRQTLNLRATTLALSVALSSLVQLASDFNPGHISFNDVSRLIASYNEQLAALTALLNLLGLNGVLYQEDPDGE
jgi:hypothetical protein